MAVAVLMPVHNEASRLAPILEALAARAAEVEGVAVFLVDDGSEPPIDLANVPARTPDFQVVLARHALNLGQGAALETARQLALAEPAFAAYVTMDSDGQHGVDGALACARAIGAGADVAFGSRFHGASDVPRGRRALLAAARAFEWALTGLRLSDAHNGLRAFNRRALLQIAIRQNRMAHATEITQRVSSLRRRARPLVIVEVPVQIRYTRDTLDKGQRAAGALTILRDLVHHYLFGEPA
jgi:glycosyltransferase involved in cell wall biosynthesis